MPNLVFQPVTFNIRCQITSWRESHFLRLITLRFVGSLLLSPDVKEYILSVRYIHVMYVLISSKRLWSLYLVGNIFLQIISK